MVLHLSKVYYCYVFINFKVKGHFGDKIAQSYISNIYKMEKQNKMTYLQQVMAELELETQVHWAQSILLRKVLYQRFTDEVSNSILQNVGLTM
jgi:hypothetical protein